jgi:hypothetical protein
MILLLSVLAYAVDVDDMNFGDLVITEIMLTPTSTTECQGNDAEYFEVRNTTGGSVNLSGLTIQDDDIDDVTLGTVSATTDGFIVLAHDAAGFEACYGFAPDFEYGNGMKLGNNGDEIYLKQSDGDLIDYVEFDSWSLPTQGKSMSLDDDAQTYLLNDTEASWCPSVDGVGTNGNLGTPGASNPSCDDDTDVPVDTSPLVDTGPFDEICDDNLDNDNDGDVDCLDPDCFAEAYCCDDDGDGFEDAACGGTDCDDTVVNVNTVDGDNIPDDCDNCPSTSNETQVDADSDGIGDECDICALGNDTVDSDGDDVPDACDACEGYDDAKDKDGDGVPNQCDDCPNHAFEDDLDGDGSIACNDCDDNDPWLNTEDEDGDSYSTCGGDCHDGDGTVSPARAESEDGVDEDCDGIVDEGTNAYDDDGDGFTENGGDCDDDDKDISPGAQEICNGDDDDCDNLFDEDLPCTDDDGDGFSEDLGDCNDGDAGINTFAAEDPDNGVDDNCNGVIDEGSDRVDDDGDGWSEFQGDCDDDDDDVHPAAVEVNNGLDDDCDSLEDETANDVDLDGYTTSNGDCDDFNGWKNPGLEEMCDQIDNNCNDVVDEGCAVDENAVQNNPAPSGCSTVGVSGSAGTILLALMAGLRRRSHKVGAVGGVALLAAGCGNDISVTNIEPFLVISPALTDVGIVRIGTTETFTLELDAQRSDISVVNVDVLNITGDYFTYIGEDSFTVGEDENPTLELLYEPIEQGFHRAAITLVTNGDPTSVEVLVRGEGALPQADVTPWGIDLGPVEEGETALHGLTVFNEGLVSVDITDAIWAGDLGFAVEEMPFALPATSHKEVDISYTAVDTEPVSSHLKLVVATHNLHSVEVIANDCENGDPFVWDVDEDGVTVCGGDCDDDDATVYANNPEVADDADNDCDGIVDEGTSGYDDDGDGYSEAEGDCDDNDSKTYPGKKEKADGVDNDCDGTVDEGTDDYDDDGDGFTENGGDCDDNDKTVNPAKGGC